MIIHENHTEFTIATHIRLNPYKSTGKYQKVIYLRTYLLTMKLENALIFSIILVFQGKVIWFQQPNLAQAIQISLLNLCNCRQSQSKL